VRTSDVVPLDLTTYPPKLLSLWSPWWWFVLHHTSPKRRENRTWNTNYRGGVWLHAALKGDPDMERTIADTLRAIPLARGRKAPDLDTLNASAGCIVARARIAGCEMNTARVCLADPWAQEGAYGFLFEAVEALPVAVPWKGSQGLVSVCPGDVVAVQIITEHGGVYVPSSKKDASYALLEAFGPGVELQQTIDRLTASHQLRHENGAYFVRSYSENLSRHYKAKKPTDDTSADAAPTGQGSFGW